MKTPAILSLLSLALLSSCTSPHGKRTFRGIDSNKDGSVTPAEFSDHVGKEAFRLLDSDGDGRVSPAEWHQKESHRSAQALFRRLDRNGDGHVDAAEFAAQPGSARRAEIDAIFHTLDRNLDSSLEWNEIAG
ncbi:MAG: hypothetical protein RLZZ179_1422 [Verrucomicrobiota bacterium]|jgi:Ca2+-binding EF-hand superfamily protein